MGEAGRLAEQAVAGIRTAVVFLVRFDNIGKPAV